MKNLFYLYVSVFFLLTTFSCSDKAAESPNVNRIQPDTTVKGCGHFALYKKVGPDLVLGIRVDHNKIQLSTDFQTFDGIAIKPFAQIEIEQNCDIRALWSNACNDGISSASCKSTLWKLQSGSFSFKVNKVPRNFGCGETYYVSAILKNATFVKENSKETKVLEEVIITNAKVGNCLG